MQRDSKSELIYADVVGTRVGQDPVCAGSFTGFIYVFEGEFELKGMIFRRYVFKPGDIQGVEPCYVFGKKISIVHNVNDYPPFISFSAHKSKEEWIGILNRAGFNLPEE
jgi:hypothetical protein